MKKIYLFIILLSCIYLGNAQSTYNYRLSFDLPVPTVFTSVEVTDSCFYMTGITVDTLVQNVSSLFSKLTLEGEIVFYKILSSPNQSYETWVNTLEPTTDGNFVVPGTGIDSIGLSTIFIKYTPDGDALLTKQYRSPYAPAEPFISGRCSKLSADGGAYILSNISNSTISYGDIYIIKVDSGGGGEWEQVYGSADFSESVESIILDGNKILIGGNYHNRNFSNQDYISRALLIQMNEGGDVEWEYKTPVGELRNTISDILKTDDGGYLLASGKGIEYGQAPGTLLQWHPYVFKLDANRSFEWGVDFRDSFPTSTNVINKMVEVSDGSGYVVAGRSYRPNYVENGYDVLGLIAKLSKEGDSLWMRRYNHVQSPSDEHVFYDLEETSDGGFVMVGEAADFFNPTSEPPIQRAWIVKVDQHGCLVPGCHLISPTIELQEAAFEMKTYPNPARDYLNVYFQHPNLRKTAYFSLVDASGKVVLEFQSQHGDITHMIPVSGLVSGSYWLRCQVGEQILSRQVVLR